jgi:tRNA-specific 2-thiouridylase
MKKIMVALSGGVDSAVAGFLLKKSGYDAAGIIMVFQELGEESVKAARRVAGLLDIPLYEYDVTREFRNQIITHFIADYKNGKTPNPCVRCNVLMKFGLLLRKARTLGYHCLATGHYARVENVMGRYYLKRGREKNEQSYFLYRLTQNTLARIVFPLASWTKKRVRSFAEQHGLRVARMKRSRDVCFVPHKNIAAFLKKHVPEKPGPIMTKNGKVVGQHRGVMFYTYGQRRGIGVSNRYAYYVTGIDAKKNILYVGRKSDVYGSRLIAGHLNFIPFDSLTKKMDVHAKVRYVARRSLASVEPCANGKITVTFRRRQWAPTPGQSVVFYKQDIVIGGGIIEAILQ